MLEIIFDTPFLNTIDGKRWSHVSSNDVNYLHEFAKKVGLRRQWFQNKYGFPHYDTYSDNIRRKMLIMGARQVDRKTFWLQVNKWYKSNFTDGKVPHQQERG